MALHRISGLGLGWYVAQRRNGEWVAWASHPTAGVLLEVGDTPDGAVLLLRARWELATAAQ